MTETTFDTLNPAQQRTIGAFKLAMHDLGVPEHPSGTCPEQPCPCAGSMELVTQRAIALLEDPDIEDAQFCEDCRILVPLRHSCYAIDCGAVVCLSCGDRRGLGDDYLLP